jgi:hypothetical protein
MRLVPTWPPDMLRRRHEAGDHDLGVFPGCPACAEEAT